MKARMPLTIRIFIKFALSLVALSCNFQLVAQAQDWPTKPLRLVIPFPPGGGSDVVGRIIAKQLSDVLQQQVVVDNRSGAGGSIGTEFVVKSNPDGYTLLLGSTSEIAVNPNLYRLNYNTVSDLTPIGVVATSPMMIISAPGFSVKTIKDLETLARQKPGEINVASAGNGTITHLSGELFKNINNLKWTHVPYKGTGPALSDLMGGQVQLMFVTAPPVLGLIKSNKVNLIAVSGKTRMPEFPDTPTVLESGGSSYSVDNWYGIFAPSKTPGEIVKKLSVALNQAVKTPELANALKAQGAEAGGMSVTEFVAYVKAESDKWRTVIKAGDIKVD